MDEPFDQAFNQAAEFQKMWTDSFTKMIDVWSRFSPGKPPPDTIREVRGELLKVLTESWDQFMRTPQFMEYMKNSLEGFMAVRKMTADVLTRNHHEMQSPAREDIDGVLLAIRHMERRLLDRMEDVENAVGTLGSRMDRLEENGRDEPLGTGADVSDTQAGAAHPAAPRKAARRGQK